MTVFALFAPHRRAAELIDLKLDAERGEAELSREDADWLDRHVSRCAKCSVVLDDRMKVLKAVRSLGTEKAPVGFAGRVMLAAKTRKVEAVEEPRGSMIPFAQWAIGAAMVVVVLVAAGVLFKTAPGDASAHKAKTALAGNGLDVEDAPHFIVRAPSIGAAKARSEIIKVVEARGGTFSDSGDAIMVRIPRSELVAVTKALASRGSFRMNKADAGELPPDLETIVLRFELPPRN